MIEFDFTTISSLLIEYVTSRNGKLSDIVMVNENSKQLIFVPDFLSAIIQDDCITVFYADECDEFLRTTFNTDKQWIRGVGDFVVLLLNHTVVAEYFYSIKRKTLLYYKIWIENNSHRRRLVKKVMVTMNPFAFLQSTMIVPKILHRI